jgi:alkylation response protein AidB-like acyl-CoA dehydrogenase
MYLAPTDEQQAIPRAARRFLEAEITRERRLEWDKTVEGHDPAFWRAVAELGWLGYGIPEAHGGQGASFLDLGLLVEECGRAVAPFGIFASLCGSLAVAELASPAQKRAWLPAIARGEALVTLAVAEARAALNPAAFATTLRSRGSRLELDGEKQFVLQGVTATGFLVAARDGRGVSLVHVPRAADGVRVEPQQTIGKDRQSRVAFRKVAIPATAVVGKRGTAWDRLERLRGRLAVLLCCDLVGSADAVLDMTVKYVCEREQFGVKLATFQAVQQMAAVMAIDVEGARHVTHQALWRLDRKLAADREIAIAKAFTARACRDVTLAAHQLHGGAGYVVEHVLHRHTLRAKQAELLFGSTEEWMDALADGMRLAGAR